MAVQQDKTGADEIFSVKRSHKGKSFSGQWSESTMNGIGRYHWPGPGLGPSPGWGPVPVGAHMGPGGLMGP